MNDFVKSISNIFTKNAFHVYITGYIILLIAWLLPKKLTSAFKFLYSLLPNFAIDYLNNLHISQQNIDDFYFILSTIVCITSLWIAFNFFTSPYTNTVVHDIHYFFFFIQGTVTLAIYLYNKLFLHHNYFNFLHPLNWADWAIYGALLMHFSVFIILFASRFILIKPKTK